MRIRPYAVADSNPPPVFCLTNVVVMQGDLYEPVGGLVFDRIVAHPPYVPVLQPVSKYCDGGEDGELALRGAVRGLPQFLARDGRFYARTMGVERDGEPFEHRVRGWLGESQSEFDILFVLEWTRGPAQFAFQKAKKTRGYGAWRPAMKRKGSPVLSRSLSFNAPVDPLA